MSPLRPPAIRQDEMSPFEIKEDVSQLFIFEERFVVTYGYRQVHVQLFENGFGDGGCPANLRHVTDSLEVGTPAAEAALRLLGVLYDDCIESARLPRRHFL